MTDDCMANIRAGREYARRMYGGVAHRSCGGHYVGYDKGAVNAAGLMRVIEDCFNGTRDK